VAWHTLSNAFYIADRLTNSQATARALVQDILTWCTVVPVNHKDALKAEALPVSDFEDALQMAAGLAVGVDVIITRDTKDYQNSPIPALTPEQFLRLHHPELLP
jgi:predicted nucleic acid-binding protein